MNNFYMSPTVSVPVPLYKSLQGKYFVGYVDDLNFSKGLSSWGSLYNPLDSDVNLFINVWTVTSLYGVFRAQVWFNASMPGEWSVSPLVSTANNTIYPQPQPKVLVLQASGVTGTPQGGTKAFVRRGQPEATIAVEDGGRFIFPPGGSFSIFLSDPEKPYEEASGRIAFGWWEEPLGKSPF